MVYNIVGINSDYPPTSVVYKLTRFLLSNPDYFEVFCDILITAKGARRDDRVDKIIETTKVAKIINIEYEDEFRALLNEYFFNEKDGRTRGAVLTCLMSKIGPMTFKTDQLNIVRECSVEDGMKNKVGGAKSFDVGFYCNHMCCVELEAELVECKIDLNNYLAREPFNKETDIKEDAKNKLEYMKCVKDTLDQCKHIVVSFATVRRDIALSAAILEKTGYKSIVNVFSFNHLKEALESKSVL